MNTGKQALQRRWWPLCLAKQVIAGKPYAVEIGAEKVALFRDSLGEIRALEDRCPHRRVPLSMGKVTSEGHLQCGYHGWTFDGRSGDLVDIPNLDSGERVPKCSIASYRVVVREGVVYGCTNASANDDLDATAITGVDYTAGTKEFFGRQKVSIEHNEFIACILDAPELIFSMPAVMFDSRPSGDPFIQNGLVVAERNVRKNWLGESRFYIGPLRHNADCPLLLRSYTMPITGHSRLQLMAIDGLPLIDVMLIATPAARSITDVHWCAHVSDQAEGKAALLLKLLTKLGVSPFAVKSSINGQALSNVLSGPAEVWRQYTATQLNAQSAAIASTVAAIK